MYSKNINVYKQISETDPIQSIHPNTVLLKICDKYYVTVDNKDIETKHTKLLEDIKQCYKDIPISNE